MNINVLRLDHRIGRVQTDGEETLKLNITIHIWKL